MAGQLTILDMAVLMGVVQGKSDGQISSDLEIAIETANAVRNELLTKYGVTTAEQLAQAALEHGPMSGLPKPIDASDFEGDRRQAA